MSIGATIRELREKSNMSQAELAQKLNMTQQAIDSWERSKNNPRKSTIDQLANIFNVSTDYLFGRLQDESPLLQLTPTDEHDIAIALEDMMNKLTKDGAISFYGKEMTEGEKEMLRISIENALRVAKQMTKDKEQNK